MKNGVIIAIVLIGLLLGLTYWNIKQEIKKLCISAAIKDLDLSNVQLIHGKNTAVVDFGLVIFNKSNTRIDIKNAKFKIFYQGELIGENVSPITFESKPNEIIEVLAKGNIYVTDKITSMLSSYLIGSSFPVEYSFSANIYGIPFNVKGSTMISKNNSSNNSNCI